MNEDELRRRVAGSRVVRVGTVDRDRLYAATDAGPTVWWVRLRGRGRAVEDAAERAEALRLLWEKYPQFGDAPSAETAGPVMAVDIERWSGWAYRD